MKLSFLSLFFITALTVLLTNCSTSVDSDGQKHRITCFQAIAPCHEEARDLCPDGYLVTNRVRPKKVNGDTQYTLNIRCRANGFFGMN